MNLLQEVLEKAREWSSNESFDQETRETVLALLQSKDEKELMNRFYTEMSFGTGGMRGIVGAGTGRINRYTFRRVTSALCLYLKKSFPRGE